MPPAPTEGAQESLRGSRVGLILILLILLGVPAFVVSGLFRSVPIEPVIAGKQPGGMLHGVVREEGGVPVSNTPVRLYVIPVEPDGSPGRGSTRVESRIRTSDQGTFSLPAPPFKGHYQLSVGGELWQRATRQVSFVDKEGNERNPNPVEIVVRPGCLLHMEVSNADGVVGGEGEFTITGKPKADSWVELGSGPIDEKGRIFEGELRWGGLPPMDATIHITMDDGRTGEVKLTLAPGIVRKKVEL